MTEARDVIEREVEIWTVRHDVSDFSGVGDACLTALREAGFAVVPVEPTEAMLRAYYQCMIGTHPKAAMNPDKYLVHNLKAKKRWFAMLKAAQGGIDE